VTRIMRFRSATLGRLPLRALPLATLTFAGSLLLAFACEPELSRESALEGKLCRAEKPRCLDGYECHSDNRPGSPLADDGAGGVCVLPSVANGLQGENGSAGMAGAAGAASTTTANPGTASAGADGSGTTLGNGAGSAGAPASSSGTISDPGAAGNGGMSANAGTAGMPSNTGDGEAPPNVDDTTSPPSADAGTPPAADDPGAATEGGSEDCTVKQLLYKDRDGDGFGSDAEGDQKMGCPPEVGWAIQGGDCLDEAPTPMLAASVHPGQTSFFETGYPDASKPGGISFDYDCRDDEVGDPTNYGGGTSAPECSSAPPCSEGSGFVGGDRSGIGINALCGSVKFIVCSASCDVVPVTAPQFRCH
jgi:hypothetical protein